MGEISIQQAVLTGSIKSSENLTCGIVPEGGVSGKMVSPDIVHEVGVETPATRDKLGLVRVGENLKITTEGVLSVDVATEADPDNSKPITSAAVNTIVGNIDALLSMI